MSDKIKLLDLFSGIGGWSLGLERTGGFETVAFCEQDKYATKVLNKNWPKIKVYDDVRTLTAKRLVDDRIGGIDAISAGWPCQDFSVAGKQAGITGERSGLWSEITRLVSELGPRFVFLENVSALISGGNGEWFGEVLGDLATLGYDAEWHCIPASALGASHRRDRIWIVAYPNSYCLWEQQRRFGWPDWEDSSQPELNGEAQSMAYPCGFEQSGRNHEGQLKRGCATASEGTESPSGRSRKQAMANTKRRQQQMGRERTGTGWLGELDLEISRAKWEPEPAVGRVADGVSHGLDRLRCLGNSLVPQIPEMIGRCVLRELAIKRGIDILGGMAIGKGE